MGEIGAEGLTLIDPMATFFARGVGGVAQKLFSGRLAEVRLFGSYAKGTARPDSDIDVLVLLRDLTPEKREEAERQLYRKIQEEDLATEGLHLLVVSPEEFNEPESHSKILRSAKEHSVEISLE